MSKTKIAGWVLSALLAGLLLMSAYFQLADWEGKEAEFAKAGLTVSQMSAIGIVEVVITLIFLIPITSFFGAVLLTGYLGGATFVHVQQGEPVAIPIVIGVLVWIALGLRNFEVFRVALGLSATKGEPEA